MNNFKTFNGQTISRAHVSSVQWGYGIQATRVCCGPGFAYDVTADEEPALADWLGVEYPPAPPKDVGDARTFLLDFLSKSGFDDSGKIAIPLVRTGMFGTEDMTTSERVVDAYFFKRHGA